MGYKGQEYVDINKNGIVKSALAVAIMNPADLPIKAELENKFIVWPYNTTQPYMKDTMRTQSVSLTQWIRQGLTFAFGRNGGAVPDDPDAMGKVAENDVNDGTTDSIRKIALNTKNAITGLSTAVTTGSSSLPVIVDKVTTIKDKEIESAQFLSFIYSELSGITTGGTGHMDPYSFSSGSGIKIKLALSENGDYTGTYIDTDADYITIFEPGLYIFTDENINNPMYYWKRTPNFIPVTIWPKADFETREGVSLTGADMGIRFLPVTKNGFSSDHLWLIGDTE